MSLKEISGPTIIAAIKDLRNLLIGIKSTT